MDKQAILDEVEETAEKTLDIIEDKVDALEDLGDAAARNKTVSTVLLTAGVVLVAVSSAYAGYKFAKRKLATKYDEQLSVELEKTRDHYAKLYKVEKFATPEEAVKNLIPESERQEVIEEPAFDDESSESQMVIEAVKAVSEYKPTSEPVAYDKVEKVRIRQDAEVTRVQETLVVKEVTQNVFTDANLDQWDYETEVAKRTYDKPYIITEEEYILNEQEYEQVRLTYFEGDDILMDAQDRPIEDPDGLVGEDNLVRFGKGSHNVNIVFVRNERLETEYEIERSTGDYAKEVHGFSHSDDDGRGVRKFRHGDDG